MSEQLQRSTSLPNVGAAACTEIVRKAPKFCINLTRRLDRKLNAWNQFRRANLQVARIAAPDAFAVEEARGWRSKGARACALGHRLAWRITKLAGAEAVWVIEDDAVLCPDFQARFSAMSIPDDWQIIYLGCTFVDEPEPISPTLVRVRGRIWETHAMIVRATAFAELHRIMAPYSRRNRPPTDFQQNHVAIDNLLVEFHRNHPVYAAYPALAWQSAGSSDIDGKQKQMWSTDGRQLCFPEMMAKLDADIAQRWPDHASLSSNLPLAQPQSMVALPEPQNAAKLVPQKIPVAQLPRSVAKPIPVLPVKPGQEPTPTTLGTLRLADLPMYCLNLPRRPDRKLRAWGAFRKHGLKVERISALDATGVTDGRGFINAGHRACSTGHRLAWRQGRQTGASGVIVFEDDVVLCHDFGQRLRDLELPNDWAVFYFGCLFQSPGPELMENGILKIQAPTHDAHAYAVRVEVWPHWNRAVAKLSHKRGHPDFPTPTASDVVKSSFFKEFPMYSIWPPMAWQQSGISNNTRQQKANYRQDGRQIWQTEAIEHLPWPAGNANSTSNAS